MPSISIWRPNGMKIFISDLLYPGEPDNLLETMASLKGMSVILAPHAAGRSGTPRRQRQTQKL